MQLTRKVVLSFQRRSKRQELIKIAKLFRSSCKFHGIKDDVIDRIVQKDSYRNDHDLVRFLQNVFNGKAGEQEIYVLQALHDVGHSAYATKFYQDIHDDLLEDMLRRRKETDKDVLVEVIESRFVLIHELMTRAVAIALCDNAEWAEVTQPLARAIMHFAAEINSGNYLDSKVMVFAGERDLTDFHERFSSGKYDEYYEELRVYAENRSVIHRNITAAKALYDYMEKNQAALKAFLLAELSRGLTVHAFAEKTVSASLKKVEKRLLSGELRGNRVRLDAQIVEIANQKELLRDRERVVSLYRALRTSEALGQLLSLMRDLFDGFGWLVISYGCVNCRELTKLITIHDKICADIAKTIPGYLSGSYKNGLVRMRPLMSSKSLKVKLSDLSEIATESFLRRVAQLFGDVASRLRGLESTLQSLGYGVKVINADRVDQLIAMLSGPPAVDRSNKPPLSRRQPRRAAAGGGGDGEVVARQSDPEAVPRQVALPPQDRPQPRAAAVVLVEMPPRHAAPAHVEEGPGLVIAIGGEYFNHFSQERGGDVEVGQGSSRVLYDCLLDCALPPLSRLLHRPETAVQVGGPTKLMKIALMFGNLYRAILLETRANPDERVLAFSSFWHLLEYRFHDDNGNTFPSLLEALDMSRKRILNFGMKKSKAHWRIYQPWGMFGSTSTYARVCAVIDPALSEEELVQLKRGESFCGLF